jgi:glycine cleavage system H protein
VNLMDHLEYKLDKWTFKVPKDLLYNENDCWAKINGKTATVGITDFLQNLMSDIVFVELPKIGSKVEQFDEAGSLESIKATLDIISPVSGVIQDVNNELVNTPDLANTDPYDKGWFLKIQLSNLESDRENLINAEAYLEVMKKKAEKEQQKLKKAQRS